MTEAAAQAHTDAASTVENVPTPETKTAEVTAKQEPSTEKKPETLLTPAEIKYELKAVKGSPLGEAHVEKVLSYAKEKNLSNEQAQQLLERENAVVTGFVDAQKEQIKKTTNEWATLSQKDTEIGGDHFKESVEMSKRVVEKYGTDLFKKALDETGLGNHPELIRFISRIAKSMAEDKLVVANQSSMKDKSMAERFYGGTTKE